MLLSALSPYLDIPYVFFGHSMGASLAFELARTFRQQDYPLPLHLFVSGRRAPQIPPRTAPTHALSEAAFLEELRRLGGTPEEVLRNKELLQLSLPILRADFTLSEKYLYKPQAPLTCPLTAYGGLQDYEVNRDDLAAWRQMTSSIFTLRLFPGDHFFLNSARADLLQILSSELLAYV